MANLLYELIRRSKPAKRSPSKMPRRPDDVLDEVTRGYEDVRRATTEARRRTESAGDPDAVFTAPRDTTPSGTKNKTVPLHVGDFDQEAWARRKLLRDNETAVPLKPEERGALREVDSRNKAQTESKGNIDTPDPDDIDFIRAQREAEQTGPHGPPRAVEENPDIDLTGRPLEQALYEMMMDKRFLKQKGSNLGPIGEVIRRRKGDK